MTFNKKYIKFYFPCMYLSTCLSLLPAVIFDFDWSAVRHVRPRKNRTRPSACCLFRTCQTRVLSPEHRVLPPSSVRSSRRTHNECLAKPERRVAKKMHYNAACQPTWTWTNASVSPSSRLLLGLHLSYVTIWSGLQPGIPGNWFPEFPERLSEYAFFHFCYLIDWLLIVTHFFHPFKFNLINILCWLIDINH